MPLITHTQLTQAVVASPGFGSRPLSARQAKQARALTLASAVGEEIKLGDLMTRVGYTERHLPFLAMVFRAAQGDRFRDQKHLGITRLLSETNMPALLDKLPDKPYRVIGAGLSGVVLREPNAPRVTKVHFTSSVLPSHPSIPAETLLKDYKGVTRYIWPAKTVAQIGDIAIETQPYAPPLSYAATKRPQFNERMQKLAYGLGRLGIKLWDFARDNFGKPGPAGKTKVIDLGALTPAPDLKTKSPAELRKLARLWVTGKAS